MRATHAGIAQAPMIARVISWSLRNHLLVLLLAALISAWGVYSLRHTALDAIPDLSDVQVIIKTTYPGQSPQAVEDQVTYPLTSALLSVPGSTAVRRLFHVRRVVYLHHFQGWNRSYWARTRVLEYLSRWRKAAARRDAGTRAGCIRRGLDF